MDAICINQDDVEERNFQVLQMGSIYSEAERVIVPVLLDIKPTTLAAMQQLGENHDQHWCLSLQPDRSGILKDTIEYFSVYYWLKESWWDPDLDDTGSSPC
jgi:Heterokaryon incompatibility protein (HET)